MSDRCSVEKTFNYLFCKYRKPVISEIVDTREDLDAKQRKCIIGVNNFYCGFHFLVGLADQAEVSLKSWESILFEKAKLGSLKHGGYSNGESGTLHLICTICKFVSKRM